MIDSDYEGGRHFSADECGRLFEGYLQSCTRQRMLSSLAFAMTDSKVAYDMTVHDC
jgi:hypothetical protein